jgi:hypothetical protein
MRTVAITGLTWGPIGAWVGAGTTLLIVATTILVSVGYFDRFRDPRLRITFQAMEPWVRHGKHEPEGRALWVRLGIKNVGVNAARGCLARIISVQTEGEPRRDVDPVQLRWAGVPRSRGFDPIDIRRDQREFVDVLCLVSGARWRLVTFEDPDFEPGFATHLPLDERHVIQISVFADNAHTVTAFLAAEAHSTSSDVKLELVR